MVSRDGGPDRVFGGWVVQDDPEALFRIVAEGDCIQTLEVSRSPELRRFDRLVRHIARLRRLARQGLR